MLDRPNRGSLKNRSENIRIANRHAVVDMLCLQVYLSVRNGAWFVRRVWDNGLPLDLALFTRCANTLFHLMPSRFVCNEVRKQVNARFDHALYGLKPSHNILANPLVTNDDFPSRILSGSVQVRPGIARLMPTGVRFTDGTCVDDVDSIICATGRRNSFSLFVGRFACEVEIGSGVRKNLFFCSFGQ